MNFKLFKYGLEEIKFIKSFSDLKIFLQKISFARPRILRHYIRDTKVPPSLQLEPTNKCNLSCICCSRNKMDREQGYMDMDLFKKIIDNAFEIGIKRVHLYLHGEPLQHPNIIDMIGYIKSKNIGISMTTNGMDLDKRKIKLILNSGVNIADHIIFSILGYSKDVHEKIMRGVNHDKVLKNVLDFIELRKKYKAKGPIIETVFYRMS
ncbi:MAG: radical SAM protein, partial [Spirochaetes bacterium]|nr:radical SAM protein [Spirochaetota bacterium]